MTPPIVSCLMPTYGRFPQFGHLVDEAVESFLRQDYPHKQLILMNDCPSQHVTLPEELEAEPIFIINAQQRSKTLGDKYNLMVIMATGDLLMPWEDDDISLPHRISKSVECIGDADYYNPQQSWFLDGRGLHLDHSHGVCHNASIFSRQAWTKVGGYPSVSGPQDAQMDGKLKRAGDVSDAPTLTSPEDWWYIYRWGVSDIHLSAYADTQAAWDAHGERDVEEGAFELTPSWRGDYAAKCAEMVAAHKQNPQVRN